jgi:hypothetical protein
MTFGVTTVAVGIAVGGTSVLVRLALGRVLGFSNYKRQ